MNESEEVKKLIARIEDAAENAFLEYSPRLAMREMIKVFCELKEKMTSHE